METILQNLTGLIIVGASLIASASFFVIRTASRRPANGELETLARLEHKIVKSRECLKRHIQEVI